jgi:hypothetical protein
MTVLLLAPQPATGAKIVGAECVLIIDSPAFYLLDRDSMKPMGNLKEVVPTLRPWRDWSEIRRHHCLQERG